jgi:hypothetical protein
MKDKEDNKVIQLPTKQSLDKKFDPHQLVPLINNSPGDVVNIEDTIRQRQNEEIKKLKQDKIDLENKLFETRRKLGILVSVNDMLKIQLNDLIVQLDFMDQHIKITTNNAKNMLAKLPNITGVDLPLPPTKE